MKVLFAPDWRAGNPYQQLLADALGRQGVEVAFAPQTHGLFRLTKAARAVGRFDLLHMHWPEAYFPPVKDHRDLLRRAFFPADLRLALAGRPLVYSGHNLYPHERLNDRLSACASRAVVRRCGALLAHSAGSVAAYAREFGISPDKCKVIPHGDLSPCYGAPSSRATARARLGLDDAPLCLVFGAVDPYKGIEGVLDAWAKAGEARIRLAVVGGPCNGAYAEHIRRKAAGIPGVLLELRRVSDAALADWMDACDCMLFNYTRILTSGSACLARARGVPVALPARLVTVDLMEPWPNVARFDDGQQSMLAAVRRAIGAGHDWPAAAGYRAVTAWDEVARQTAQVYHSLLFGGR